MTSSLAAGNTASIAISRNTAYAPWDPTCEVKLEEMLASTDERVYERRAVNGAVTVALPIAFVATIRTWYSPVVASEPVHRRPFQSTFCGPASSCFERSVAITIPLRFSTVTVTFAV